MFKVALALPGVGLFNATGAVVTLQLLPSVTVNVYVPANRSVNTPDVAPVVLVVVPDAITYVFVPVPPVALTEIVPVPPGIGIAVVTDALAMIGDGWVIVTLLVDAVQLFASFTVTVYVPAPTVNVLPDWNAPPFKLYCNAPVPPLAVTVSVVVPPLHAIAGPADADAVMAGGAAATVTLFVDAVQLFASFTVTV